MLKIGDFSKLSRISIRMLRHYDEIGLLIPADIDFFTNYRYYSETQLTVASRISMFKSMGFSLNDIAIMIKNQDNVEILSRFFAAKQLEVQEQEKELSYRILLLQAAIQRLREDKQMMKYDVIFKTLPMRTVASVRKIIPTYSKEGILWNIIKSEIAPLQVQYTNPSYGLAIYHDEGYKETDVDVEIQISVKGKYFDTENVHFKTVLDQEVVSSTYKGSYDQLTAVNEAIASWIHHHGYELNGSMFCIYHVGPSQTTNPNEWVSEVCFPVKKK